MRPSASVAIGRPAENMKSRPNRTSTAVEPAHPVRSCLQRLPREPTSAGGGPMYEPKPEHRFSFGLWTVGNIGVDPFGEPVRDPLSPVQLVELLADVGAWGVNFHDNDLVPIDATPDERDRIVADFRKALDATGIVVPMATTNLFKDPAFRDGAFTANDARVRAFALQKTMRAIDLGVELGAKVYVFWGGREGVETDAAKDPLLALSRMRDALNFLSEYVRDNGYDLRFALESKPNEPRADIYLSTTGAMLGFIESLDHPEMVGVNPEVAHEHMAGLNFTHHVAQAWWANKLFHVDLNDQLPGRYDQDFRFGSANPKAAFWLVKFLEDVGYEGSRHFDAHAYRTSDYDDVKAFARGCMRTYLILKEKAERWNADSEIQGLIAQITAEDESASQYLGPYSRERASALTEVEFDRRALGERGQPYEALDQLTVELLLGIR
jgi:xylose isomerase